MKTALHCLGLLLLAAAVAAAQDADNGDTTVYVTKTGAKYHTAGCRYLRTSSIPVKLRDAAARYAPCSVCNPPVLRTASDELPARPAREASVRADPPKVEAPPKPAEQPKAAEKAAAPEVAAGRLIRVEYVRTVDGDTIVVRLDGKEEHVRLLCINAPEKDQPGFHKASAALEALLEKRDVYLEFDPKMDRRDKYDRLLAWIWAGRDLTHLELVNSEMVRAGHAKLYDQYGLGKYGERLKNP